MPSDRGGRPLSGAIAQLAKHSSVYAIGTLLSRAVSFLLLPFYTTFLTPFDYGVLDLLDTTSGMIGLVAGFGMAAAISRFYFDFEDDRGRASAVSTALLLAAASAILVMMVAVPLSGPLTHALFGPKVSPTAMILAFSNIAVGLVMNVSNIYLRLLNRSAMFVTLSLANLVIGVSLNVWFVGGLHLGVQGVLYSNLITTCVCGAPLIVWTLRQVGLRFDRVLAGKMYRYGLPLMPAEIASVAIGYSDRYFINGFLSTADAGIYGMAQKLGTALHYLITSPFLSAFITQRFAIGSSADARQTLANIFKYHMVVLVVPSALLALFSAEILALMTAPEFHAAEHYIPLAALAMIVLATKYHFEFGILREKRTTFHMYINTSSAVLHIICNALLIPWIGLWGASIAGVLAYAAKSIGYLSVSQRLFRVPYPLGQFGLMLLIASVVVVFADLALPLGWMGFLVKCVLAVALAGLPILVGLLTREDLFQWLTLARGKFSKAVAS